MYYMDYGGGDHQTASQGCVWLFGCSSNSVSAGLDCAAYRLYTCSVCDKKSAAGAAVCGLWRYISLYSFVYAFCHLTFYATTVANTDEHINPTEGGWSVQFSPSTMASRWPTSNEWWLHSPGEQHRGTAERTAQNHWSECPMSGCRGGWNDVRMPATLFRWGCESRRMCGRMDPASAVLRITPANDNTTSYNK